MANSKR